MSHYFVLWSGGLDSTYLIEHLLTEGHKVTAGYIEVKNNDVQTKRELEAIDKLQVIFNKLYHQTFKYNGIVLSINVLSPSSNLILQQAAIWTSSWITVPKECDYIALGYVMNDCALSYLDDIRNAFNGIAGLVYKHIPVVFPLIKYSKPQIWDNISYDLQKHITWCESLDQDKCGQCVSCKRMINDGLFTIQKMESINIKISVDPPDPNYQMCFDYGDIEFNNIKKVA